MEEIQNQTAETTAEENSTGADVHADVSEKQEDSSNDVEFKEEAGSGDDRESAKRTQSRVENSENARRRREAERQKELNQARINATLEALNRQNPYTGREMKDAADVEEYFAMKKIEKDGGDPIADFSEYHKNKEREAARQKEESEKEAEWFRCDREQFAKKYPDVDLAELVKDKKFIRYADGKVRKMPMSEIYEGYAEMLGEFEAEANTKAKRILANKKASPGALSSSYDGDGEYFTPEQVRSMSAADVHRNYDKIRESMKKWK